METYSPTAPNLSGPAKTKLPEFDKKYRPQIEIEIEIEKVSRKINTMDSQILKNALRKALTKTLTLHIGRCNPIFGQSPFKIKTKKKKIESPSTYRISKRIR